MQNKYKFRLSFFLIMIFIVSFLSISLLNFLCIKNNISVYDSSALEVQDQNKPNIQTYTTSDGEERIIYWAKGVQAPKMVADNDSRQGTTGYFRKDIDTSDNNGIISNFVKYRYIMENNKGYYDLNKNLDSDKRYPQQVGHHCYFASALNLLHWWLEENSSFIDEYLAHLRANDGVYEQGERLKKILPFNEEMWTKYRKTPTLLNVGKYISQDLSNDAMYTSTFPEYHALKQGYFPDMVIDNFINGYFALDLRTSGLPGEQTPNENDIEHFTPSLTGGYFYPIFYKEKVTKKYSNSNFEFFQKLFKDVFINEKMLSISYFSAGKAHAITCWGAEYDKNGNIKRIYVTDSDDYDFVHDKAPNSNVLNGLFSYEFIKEDGLAFITNCVDNKIYNKNQMQGATVIDLKQDVWKKKLADIKAPLTPQFEIQPQSTAYASNDPDILNLSVKVKREDTGYYTYQWYKSNSNGVLGEKILNATSEKLKPDKPSLTPMWYYCEVVNHKNGKMSTPGRTQYAKIYVDENVTNAEKPKGSYNKLRNDYIQYQQPVPIIVNAKIYGEGTLSYQWYHKIGAMDNSPTGGEKLEGETNNIFYPTDSTDFDENNLPVTHIYYCIVTNYNPKVNGKQRVSFSPPYSPSVTVVKGANFENSLQPIIVHQPKSATYNNSNEIQEISVMAKSADKGNLSFQWYENYKKIIGATQSTYTPKPTKSGTYNYYCEIKNTNNKALNSKENIIKSDEITIQINGEISQSSNADLSALEVVGQTLSPTFDKDTTTYNINVGNAISSVTIKATAEHEKGSIKINDIVLDKNGNLINLLVGKNIINLLVTAENGATKTYTINVTRAEKEIIVDNDNSGLTNEAKENIFLIGFGAFIILLFIMLIIVYTKINKQNKKINNKKL